MKSLNLFIFLIAFLSFPVYSMENNNAVFTLGYRTIKDQEKGSTLYIQKGEYSVINSECAAVVDISTSSVGGAIYNPLTDKGLVFNYAHSFSRESLKRIFEKTQFSITEQYGPLQIKLFSYIKSDDQQDLKNKIKNHIRKIKKLIIQNFNLQDSNNITAKLLIENNISSAHAGSKYSANNPSSFISEDPQMATFMRLFGGGMFFPGATPQPSMNKQDLEKLKKRPFAYQFLHFSAQGKQLTVRHTCPLHENLFFRLYYPCSLEKHTELVKQHIENLHNQQKKDIERQIELSIIEQLEKDNKIPMYGSIQTFLSIFTVTPYNKLMFALENQKMRSNMEALGIPLS